MIIIVEFGFGVAEMFIGHTCDWVKDNLGGHEVAGWTALMPDGTKVTCDSEDSESLRTPDRCSGV